MYSITPVSAPLAESTLFVTVVRKVWWVHTSEGYMGARLTEPY